MNAFEVVETQAGVGLAACTDAGTTVEVTVPPFEAVFGYAPHVFRDPVQSALDLLDLRVQTAAAFLARLAAGEAVDAAEIQQQGALDLGTVIAQERAARQQASR